MSFKLIAGIASIATALLFSRASSAQEISHDSEQMGICITNVQLESHGIRVDFVTDVEPPYRVGLHLPAELNLARARPLAFVDTSERTAFIKGNWLDVACFVQVYKKTPEITPEFTSVIKDGLWNEAKRRICSSPVRTEMHPEYSDDAPNMDLSGFQPGAMTLCADGKWTGFVKTDDTSIRRTIKLYPKNGDGDALEVICSASGRNPSVGTGFRIVITENPLSAFASPAYSSRPDMSEPVLIKRGWKSLSAHGGMKFSTDYFGCPVFLPCTNAVQDRIYGGKGL